MASPRTTLLQLRRVLPALAALKALLAHLAQSAYESVVGLSLLALAAHPHAPLQQPKPQPR